MKHFEDWFFLVAPLHKEAHTIICTIETGTKDMCIDLFYKYWNKGHFLTRKRSYFYKESDLSQEELYLKKRLSPLSQSWVKMGASLPGMKLQRKI